MAYFGYGGFYPYYHPAPRPYYYYYRRPARSRPPMLLFLMLLTIGLLLILFLAGASSPPPPRYEVVQETMLRPWVTMSLLDAAQLWVPNLQQGWWRDPVAYHSSNGPSAWGVAVAVALLLVLILLSYLPPHRRRRY